MKVSGKANDCPWSRVLSLPRDALLFSQIREGFAGSFRVLQKDAAAGIEQVSTSSRPLWVSSGGSEMKGRDLIVYLFAEQAWVAAAAQDLPVRSGEVVVDVGAHVGVFTDHALRRGASKVIAIEPDPVNVECIRRNFAAEIQSGHVVLVAEGAWHEEGTIELNSGVANSGTGSMMYKEQGSSAVKVRVRPVDAMLRELGISRVDFIKMDIEGAERNALKGAAQTLRRFKPRLMLDSYHLPDDGAVLPQVIRAANAGYVPICGPCELNDNHGARVAPHVIFWR